MKGKPPKEREQYVIRMDNGTLVEVTRDVYLTWYQSLRRERYQEEQSRKHGVCSLNELEEKGDFFSKPANGGEGAEESGMQPASGRCQIDYTVIFFRNISERYSKYSRLLPKNSTKSQEANIERIVPEDAGTGDIEILSKCLCLF